MHTKPRTHTHTGRRTHTGHGTLYWSPPPNPLVHSLRFTTDDECAAQFRLLLLVEATLRRPIYPSWPFPPSTTLPSCCRLWSLLFVSGITAASAASSPSSPSPAGNEPTSTTSRTSSPSSLLSSS